MQNNNSNEPLEKSEKIDDNLDGYLMFDFHEF
jgi:hypothetical protein